MAREGCIKIRVQTNQLPREFSVSVLDGCSVEMLKDKIYSECPSHPPVHYQTIFFEGRFVWNNSATLNELNISQGAVIRLMVQHMTPLGDACFRGDPDAIDKLLSSVQHQQGPIDPYERCGEKGGVAAMCLNRMGRPFECLQRVLRLAPHGDLLCDKNGCSTLHSLCLSSLPNSIRLFVSSLSSPLALDLPSDAGETPIFRTVTRGPQRTQPDNELLTPEDAFQALLESAVQRQASVELDLQSRHGCTVLMLACSRRQTNIVRLLLAQQPPPRLDLQDNQGKTCLDHAMSNVEIQELLIRAGATHGNPVI